MPEITAAFMLNVFIRKRLTPENIKENIIKHRLFIISLLILKPKAIPFIMKAEKIRIIETAFSLIPSKTVSEEIPPVKAAKKILMPLDLR